MAIIINECLFDTNYFQVLETLDIFSLTDISYQHFNVRVLPFLKCLKILQSLKRSSFPLFSYVHRELTVRFPALFASLFSRSPFKKRSKCVHFVQRSLIVRSVFIHFHSEPQNEKIGLCKSQQNDKGGRKLILHSKHNFSKYSIR